ncbi:MAG: single-stranded DNA-binding protein [Planctomycetota bacterium]|jgi:single-strand DNA-binding protein|nr:single-stranded DNA-binding protein [Planctomycetota bacterium]
MASFNKVILLGNVTRDPELRYVSTGTPVTEIGLAVNSRRKGPNGDWIEETTFVDVTFWSREAEIAGEYVTKGSPIMIEGRLKLDTWEKDGKKNSKLRVVGDRLVLLGNRQGAPEGGKGGAEGASRPNRPAAAGRPEQPEDLPDFSQATYDGPGRDGGGRSSDAVSPGGSDDDIPF